MDADFTQMGSIRRLRFKAYHYNKGTTDIVAREMISIGQWRRRSPEQIRVNLRPSAVGFRSFVAFAALLCNRSVSVFSVSLW
jgi:hypothetical protein